MPPFRPNRRIRRLQAQQSLLLLCAEQGPSLARFLLSEFLSITIHISHLLDLARARYARRHNLSWFEGVPSTHPL